MGIEVHFCHIPFQSGDEKAMHSYWRERLHVTPYDKPWKKIRIAGIPMPDKITSPLAAHGLGVMPIDYFFNDALLPHLREINQRIKPDAVMVEYVFFSKAFEAFPASTHRVIDTHDLFSNRHKKFIKAGLHAEWFFTNEAQERKGLQRAQSIIAIQEHERESLERIAGQQVPVHTVQHLATPTPLPPPMTLKTLLYIGGRNTINEQALAWFLEQVWPILLRKAPELQLNLAGSICQLELSALNVKRLGHVESLRDAYEASDLVINPARAGSGLSIKSAEALCFARPLITTQHGAQGLPQTTDNQAFITVDSSTEMADAIIRLFETPGKLATLSLAAKSLYQSTIDSSMASLKQAITPILN
ncbi:glycosyltransferase [Cerasicoccus fimbriatus]|uniref:glycosyltransferase n=1 Tax=Cerasicoccus fimbriatus TaxID=3014554 RepID=UPI0022B4B900|nr:glycosyltransferase [Cerasicoccus sp. TK19100]